MLAELGTDIFFAQMVPSILAVGPGKHMTTMPPGHTRYELHGVPYWIHTDILDAARAASMSRNALVGYRTKADEQEDDYSMDLDDKATAIAGSAPGIVQKALRSVLTYFARPAPTPAPVALQTDDLMEVKQEYEDELDEESARMYVAGGPARHLVLGHPAPMSSALAGTLHGPDPLDPTMQQRMQLVQATYAEVEPDMDELKMSNFKQP